MIVGMYDMGNRFIEDRLAKANITFSEMWGSAHEGRYWKRKLSKARRRAAKRLCRYGEDDLAKVERGLPGIESNVNWKNW
jgi:hypothetical protein